MDKRAHINFTAGLNLLAFYRKQMNTTYLLQRLEAKQKFMTLYSNLRFLRHNAEISLIP